MQSWIRRHRRHRRTRPLQMGLWPQQAAQQIPQTASPAEMQAMKGPLLPPRAAVVAAPAYVLGPTPICLPCKPWRCLCLDVCISLSVVAVREVPVGCIFGRVQRCSPKSLGERHCPDHKFSESLFSELKGQRIGASSQQADCSFMAVGVCQVMVLPEG